MQLIERPKDGFACVVSATGRRSDWVPVAALCVTETFVYIEGGLKGIAAAEFSWVGLSHIEYCTDAEMEAIKKAEASRAAKEAKP